MLSRSLLPWLMATAATCIVSAQNPSWDNSTQSPFTPITLNATDGSVSAVFIPYGATVTHLFVKDKGGVTRDLVLGYEDPVTYSTDPTHPNFGPVVGRYANRIKNNTYTDYTTNQTYYSVANENNGLDTLHGGLYGWSWRPWTVTNVTTNSVSFAFFDPNGLEGFPGQVTSQVVYTLREGGIWDIDMYAQTTARTPLLLSSHVYWNFDGYSVANSSVRDWIVHMPYANQIVATDSILIPTGNFTNVTGTAYDFTTPTKPSRLYDTCFVNQAWVPPTDPKLEVYSPYSGIKLSLTTNQPAIQIYSCGGMNNTYALKSTQGNGTVGKESCMVIEAEDVIDAINNPQWGIDQWYSPSRPYEWHSTYTFSIV